MKQEVEDLREALASANQRLAAQDARLRELELVLSGLQAIRVDDEPAAAWDRTFDLLRSALDFRTAIVLEPKGEDFTCLVSTDAALIGRRWARGPLFDHAAAGRGAVVPDLSRLPEWGGGDHQIGAVGAILAPVAALGGRGLLILCGGAHGAYAASDLALVVRLGLVVSQTLAAGRQRQLAEAIERSELKREAAVRANEAKSQFFANMSHELRTPMNGVVTVADLLGRTHLDPRQREMVDLIRSSGRMLEGLLNDVLDFAKVESGGLRLEARPFDLMGDLRSVIDLFETRADEKGLRLQVCDTRPAAQWYEGDSLRIRQVVNNLLSNALKFTQEGGVFLTIGAEPDEAGAWRVTITVSDTGIGFAPEVSDRLFERFEQADNSITRKFGGTGLGLAISRRLARLMGGDVIGRPRMGGGAEFEFTFLAPQAAPAASGEAGALEQAGASGALSVLVAEDNPNNQRIVGMILEMTGAAVRFAENGQEACEALLAQDFDAVLMDLQMPVMDGLTAIRTIRARERVQGLARTPIIAVSANAMTHHVEEALKAGADAHVSKPIDPGALLTQLMTLCGDEEPAAQQALGL